MRKFACCKVVLAILLIGVVLGMCLLLYFSERNKCDGKKRDSFLLGPVKVPHEGLGEMGKQVIIRKEDQEKLKEMFKINQFNYIASEIIALNKSLPDVRLEGCKTRVYPEILWMVLCHNEA